ncbi:hypothetical protein ABPG77_010496 [Micractinium sp. CCAP 211/92]
MGPSRSSLTFRCLRLAFWMLAVLRAHAREEEDAPTVHTLIATECTRYFTWRVGGQRQERQAGIPVMLHGPWHTRMVYSFKKVKQPGRMTRLMSCTQERWEKLPEADRAYIHEVPTHWAPSYSHHPRTGDWYTGINKPVAMADWLAKTEVQEDYVLLIDADMIMRLPVLPHELGAAPGTAVSGFFGYMIGVNNELALRHVPEVEPRWDEVAGPPGRRGDQVGGFTMMHREDLRRVAPGWIKYSEDVRADKLAWNQTGDVYAVEGEPVWIAEMYGYSFGCSKAGVWHITDRTFQLYPGYEVSPEHFKSPPKVLHYGILWNVTSSLPDAEPIYQFDKHWFEEFDALACPPWEINKQGMFAHPPRPSQFNTTGYQLFRDLLAVQPVIALNQAFCDRHRRNCPPSEQLNRECSRADALAQELEVAWARVRQPAEQEGEGTKLQQPADDGGRLVIINATAKAAQTAAEAAGAAAKAAIEAQRAAEAAAAQAAAHAHAAATQAVVAQASAAQTAAVHASAHARAAEQAAARAAHAAGTLQAAAQAAGKAAEAAAQASAAAAAGAAGAQAAADQALGVQAAASRNAAASEGIGVRRELSPARDSISEAASGQPQPDAGGVEDSSPNGKGQHSEL